MKGHAVFNCAGNFAETLGNPSHPRMMGVADACADHDRPSHGALGMNRRAATTPVFNQQMVSGLRRAECGHDWVLIGVCAIRPAECGLLLPLLYRAWFRTRRGAMAATIEPRKRQTRLGRDPLDVCSRRCSLNRHAGAEL